MFIRSALLLLLISSFARANESTIESVARSKVWHKLLHHNSRMNKTKFVDPSFFYSPKGQENPEEELKETLKQIESESESTPESLRFACRFPARKRFIEQELKVSPKVTCSSHEEWLKRHRPEAVSFIFTSQFVGNPVSSFGHTFLRFDRGRLSHLLGLSLSYFAKANPRDNPFEYAFKGLSGGYVGHFEFDNYYPKAQKYGSKENRDLWEYQLNLSADESLRVLEHAKELSTAGQAKYYFLDRNCAFFLLTILDVARADLNLSDEGDKLFLTPQDTLKILSHYKLLQEEKFRPSLRRKSNLLYTSLSFKQREIIKKVLSEKASVETVSEPQTLSTLTAILAMRESSEKPDDSRRLLFEKVSNARALLPMETSDLSQLNDKNSNPLYGHETYLAHFGLTRTDLTPSFQIGFRPALHAVEELPSGFLPNTELVFLETILRVEGIDEKSKIRLRKLSFIDVKSLPSYSVINNSLSWTAQLAVVPTLGSECIDCRATRVSGAMGYSTDLRPGFLVFALAGPTIDAFVPEKKLQGRGGPTLSSGIISSMIESIVLKFENRLDYFVFDPYSSETIWTADASLTWHVSKNNNISVQGLRAINLHKNQYNSTDLVMRSAWHF